jgi:hypothetical protein
MRKSGVFDNSCVLVLVYGMQNATLSCCSSAFIGDIERLALSHKYFAQLFFLQFQVDALQLLILLFFLGEIHLDIFDRFFKQTDLLLHISHPRYLDIFCISLYLFHCV